VSQCGASKVAYIGQKAQDGKGITQDNTFLRFYYNNRDYAIYYLDSGYMRLRPKDPIEYGTSVITLPILWVTDKTGKVQRLQKGSSKNEPGMSYRLLADKNNQDCSIELSTVGTNAKAQLNNFDFKVVASFSKDSISTKVGVEVKTIDDGSSH